MQRYVPSSPDVLRRMARQQPLICHAFLACPPVEYIAASLASLARRAMPPAQRPSGILSAHGSRRRFAAFASPAHARRSLATASTLTSPPPAVPETVQDEPADPATQHSTAVAPVVGPLSKTRASRKKIADPWTPQEDNLLLDLRQRGVGWKKISSLLQRPVYTCYTRYYRFLDPFLADAEGGDPKEDELMKNAVEAARTVLESNIKKELLERSHEKSGLPLPYSIQGPWTAQDRERLETLIKAQTPWIDIARELQRNQESCKEKWLRIRKSRTEAKRQSRRIRGAQWVRLFKEGFGPHYQNLLVAAVEKQLAAKQARTNDVDDPLDLLGMETGQRDAGAFVMMMMNQTSTFPEQDDAGNEHDGANGSKLGGETIDWDEIAVDLNNKFPPERLKTIYHELATAKRIWTPEEDDRLIRAVVRLGPPEFQPNLWNMIRDAFGDDIRTSQEYKSRWRVLDMPQLDREWDQSEKTKFWRRWTEYQKKDSLLSLPQFAETEATADTPSSSVAKDNMWDVIAEGLEYRHGRDCEMYFKHTTAAFPKDPEVFRYLTQEVASVYLKPLMASWPQEASEMLIATVNSYYQAGKVVVWKSVAKALGHQFTAAQCQARWVYWAQKQKDASDQGPDQDPGENIESGSRAEAAENAEASVSDSQPWTDQELEMLRRGVQKYGHKWTAIRNAFLPSRTCQMLHERYWRGQARKTGRFTEKERSLLEAAMETFGEDADWGLIASQVPGRTANQCRNNWRYARTHHVLKLDEPWTDKDRERLKLAVDRFGTKKWTLISEFVVGKTPTQCRMEWNGKLDPGVKRGTWSGKELDQLMERVETIMSRKEEEERRRIAEAEAPGSEGASQAPRDLAPRYKGKRKVDWREVAKGMDGRTPDQCRSRFQVNRELYRIQGDY